MNTIHTTSINLNNNLNYSICEKIHTKYLNGRFICVMFEYYDVIWKNDNYFNTYTCNIGQCYNKK
jgi:hypothetical protein